MPTLWVAASLIYGYAPPPRGARMVLSKPKDPAVPSCWRFCRAFLGAAVVSGEREAD